MTEKPDFGQQNLNSADSSPHRSEARSGHQRSQLVGKPGKSVVWPSRIRTQFSAQRYANADCTLRMESMNCSILGVLAFTVGFNAAMIARDNLRSMLGHRSTKSTGGEVS